VTDNWDVVPGVGIDIANKLMKPVTNLWTTYRRLAQNVYDGKADRVHYQTMAKWIADNRPFPARAFREWVTWVYKENQLARGLLRLRGRRADLHRIEQSLLIVTAEADPHRAAGEHGPLLDLVQSTDVTHFARPGGHIGLMAGSKARRQIWPELTNWLSERSERSTEGPLPARHATSALRAASKS